MYMYFFNEIYFPGGKQIQILGLVYFLSRTDCLISTETFVAITFPFEECNERKNVCAFKAVKTTLIK